MFLWRLAVDVLPSKNTLFERTGKGDPCHAMCVFTKETLSHLFIECLVAKAIAFCSKWGLKLNAVVTSNSQDLVRWCVNSSDQMVNMLGGKDFTTLLLATFLYVVWELRNDRVFESKSSISQATIRWNSLVEEFKSVALERSLEQTVVKENNWTPPQSGRICINTDAACNPDKSAIALIARDDKWKDMLIAAKPVPPLRVEMAELKAIEWALTIAKEFDWPYVDWLCDFLSVVNQINAS
ncbi:uncharacterized protein LOC107429552 [Ziziphus jujuba]|uniref:Uncharacterized protein LOC107429552 n=1 Tax=Ziziphus jujuba TaxID=326968 RepID=A0A6P4AFL1_ZIZJJ|nr:uncharacterized protein LOC107429552 [Ziziphus jujuba]